MKLRLSKRALVATVAAAGIASVGLLAPAHAATRTTVIMTESNAMTSLNPLTPDTNLVTNTDVAYLTGASFNYYDNKENLVDNKVLGTYKIIKSAKTDFQVQYTVNPGRVWSDGAPITGADLLLSHVLTSSAYSKKAGLGDPADGSKTPVFNGLNYGGTYDNHVVGLPVLSADKMSVTIKYDSKIPDWKIQGPGPFPVHALELIAAGKKALPTVAEANAATDLFVKDFSSYNTANLTKMGTIWSNDYNISTVDSSTNPLLLISNGGYIIQSAVANQSTTFVVNPKYNSGPALSGIATIVLKYGVADGSPSAQALSNKEIDVYDGQPTADAVAQLKKLSGVTVIGANQASYEHIDLRVGSGPGEKDAYTGPFAGSSQKALDLRKAFLLAYPRQDIVDKLVKPINSAAVVLDSTWVLPDSTSYASFIKGNGSLAYRGTQAARTAAALKLVRKYYPTAGKATPINVTLLFGQPTNTRRVSEAALLKAAEAAVGFNVNTTPTSGWSAHLAENKWDAEFYAWSQSSIVQAGNCETFKSDGGNMFLGYKNAVVDATCKALQDTQLPDSTVLSSWQKVEKQINADAITLGIFQFPAVTAYVSDLQGIKPGPLSPNIVWNYWEWHY